MYMFLLCDLKWNVSVRYQTCPDVGKFAMWNTQRQLYDYLNAHCLLAISFKTPPMGYQELRKKAIFPMKIYFILCDTMVFSWCKFGGNIKNKGVATWALFQFKDRLSMYGESFHKDGAVSRPSYLYKGNSHSGKTSCVYWNGPLRAKTIDPDVTNLCGKNSPPYTLNLKNE